MKDRIKQIWCYGLAIAIVAGLWLNAADRATNPTAHAAAPVVKSIEEVARFESKGSYDASHSLRFSETLRQLFGYAPTVSVTSQDF